MSYFLRIFIFLLLFPYLASSEVSNFYLNEKKSKASYKESFQLAGARPPACLSPYLEISPLVYQSVAAPQRAPMHEQPYQDDPDNPQFSSYDLVSGKPAGVLVRVDRHFSRNERWANFTMKLYVNGDEYSSSCFHNPLSGEMKDGQQKECSFKGLDFKDRKIYKFFPLPILNSKSIFWNYDTFNLKIVVALTHDENCKAEKEFQINAFQIPPLKLGFTRIDNPRGCKAYNRVRTRAFKAFVNSQEVKWYIYAMFPVPNTISKVFDTIEGECDARRFSKRPSKPFGLLKDIDKLERLRFSNKQHKLFAITSFEYFHFYNKKKGDAGFVLEPKWESGRFAGGKYGFLGGSWNIAFIKEYAIDEHGSQIGNLNRGVVLHELAHTLGQGREFYKAPQRCREFNGSSFKNCNEYEISRSLETWTSGNRRVWNFLKDKYSIMNNRGSIKDRWIDRETYQKNLWIFSYLTPAIPSNYELYGQSIIYFRDSKSKESSTKAIISGFYDEKEDSFVVPKITVNKTDLNTDSFPEKIGDKKIPLMTFQLRENGKVLQEVKRPVFPMNIKTLYVDETSQTEPFDFSHAMAVFQLPKDREKRNLEVRVLNPKRNKIYSAFLSKKVKETVEAKNLVSD